MKIVNNPYKLPNLLFLVFHHLYNMIEIHFYLIHKAKIQLLNMILSMKKLTLKKSIIKLFLKQSTKEQEKSLKLRQTKNLTEMLSQPK